MYIKILKCSISTHWYNSYIGYTFEIIDCRKNDFNGKHYYICKDRFDLVKKLDFSLAIYKEDCIIVKEFDRKSRIEDIMFEMGYEIERKKR